MRPCVASAWRSAAGFLILKLNGNRASSRATHPRSSACTSRRTPPLHTVSVPRLLVGEAFRLQGYEVTELGGEGPDGGVDLVLRKGKEKFLVQCKQWKAFKVGVQVVRELYGVMAAKGAAGGFVVTSGSFTEDAMAFASGRNVNLVDGPKLFGLIQQAKAARGGQSGQVGRVDIAGPARPVTPAQGTAFAAIAVTCPSCSSTMVRRVAKRGDNAGKPFWGCTRYPAGCRGTRPWDEPTAH